MAIDADGRLATFRTVGEALRTTWTLRVPYLALVCLIAAPWVIASAMGMFDGLVDLLLVDRATPYPFAAWAAIQVSGFFSLVVFAIIWQRYVLLGRKEALAMGFAQFNRIFWLTTGCGILAIVLGNILEWLLKIGGAVVGGLLAVLLSMVAGHVLPWILLPPLLIAIYIALLVVAARVAPVFSAVAAGEWVSIRDCWAQTRRSGWRLAGAILLTGLPVLIFADQMKIRFLVALRLDQVTGSAGLAALDYWWLAWGLVPILALPVALAFAVTVIAYRDLCRIRSAATATGDRLHPAE